MTRIRRALVIAALVVGTIGCDRVTKRMAESSLAGEPRQSFLSDTVRLEYVENRGAFLSLGAQLPPTVRTGVFTFGTALLLVGMVITAIRQRWTGLPVAGLALLASGGASNLIDRVLRGGVVDFMNVGIGPLRTGIFNVADMAVLAGVALFVVAQYRSSRGAPAP